MTLKFITMKEISDRDRDLLEAYQKAIEISDYPFSLTDVLQKTVNMPAKRFYSSTKYACMCIKAMKQGKPVIYQQKEKERMIHEVFSRVQQEEIAHPDVKLDQLIEIVMDRPAPEFYLKISSAKVIICKAKQKKRFNEEQLINSRYDRIQRRKNRSF